MFVTMKDARWQVRSLRIPKSPGSRDYFVFKPDGGKDGDGVYEVPDELGHALCHSDAFKVKTAYIPESNLVYRESMFIEGAFPRKKTKTGQQVADELEALQAKLDLLISQAAGNGVAISVEQDELEAIQYATETAGLVQDNYEIDEDDPSGRYVREGGLIHDTVEGSFICPICQMVKTTGDVADPKKAIQMHMRMKHKEEMG